MLVFERWGVFNSEVSIGLCNNLLLSSILLL